MCPRQLYGAGAYGYQTNYQQRKVITKTNDSNCALRRPN